MRVSAADPTGARAGAADHTGERARAVADGETSGREVLSPRGEPFTVVGRAGPVELRGAPPIPAEAREELLVIKEGELFLCTRPDGDVGPAQVSGEGFYAYDTATSRRSAWRWGGAPVALSYAVDAERAAVDATNGTLHRGARAPVPQLSLSIAGRSWSPPAGCTTGRVRNFLSEPVTTTVALALAADFADMFEVRGALPRPARGHALAPKRTARGLTLAYVGEDEVFRETVVELEPTPAPAHVELDGEGARARWEVTLAPHEATAILMTAEPSLGGRRRSRRRPQTAAAGLAEAQARWEAECTGIETDNELFNEVLAASARDLRALTVPAPGGQILAAGIPWYVAPFGRDALVSAGEAVLLDTRLSRDALMCLAKLQAVADDPWRDAEPGKILHELRVGELAGAGLVPHTPYYGTADATPLWVMRVADYYAWTGDLQTVRGLRPALDAALAWIDEYGDRDGDGFVEYECRSPGGLRNQGWKDSGDAVVHADGTLAEGSIALVEVQGYVYAARQGAADVYEALGEPQRAASLRAQAQELRAAFDEAYWNPTEGTYALALDGRKRQVASVTSNPGHCLYCGIVEPHRAAALAARLLADDMFSGWGVRTLSSENPAYNPMSYHCGSVWPHDNAILAAGLKRYGHQEGVRRIAGALFEVAARARDSRLPELYCGFDRAERAAAVAYPVACIPQAWAAAAPLQVLQALLGISADAPGGALTIAHPELPEWLGSVTLRGLAVGDARVTLDFKRGERATSFTLVEQTGELNVTMAAGR